LKFIYLFLFSLVVAEKGVKYVKDSEREQKGRRKGK
jgi:hypothetical protein